MCWPISRPITASDRPERSSFGSLSGVERRGSMPVSTKTSPRGQRETGGCVATIWGACMKSILVPTEPGSAMASALDTALLLARKFDSFIEGFSLRPAVADLVAMDPDSGLTMVAVKENDAEMVRQAEDMFRSFMQHHQIAERSGDGAAALSWSWLKDAPSGHDFVGSYGRVFDAIVLARPGDEWQSPSMITLESALFESGRPVLIAPPTSPRSPATNILVAWHCRTEQARSM